MIYTVTPNPVQDRTLTVRQIVFDAVLRASHVRLDWGGKGFNVSRALLGLGSESVAMGFVGGSTGRQVEEGLHSLGITTDFVTIQGETRTNIVITDDAASRYLKVNEAGPTVSIHDQERLFARVRERLAPGDLWVLAGSLPPGLSPDFYARLVALIQKAGARTALDTSGEPLRLGTGAGPYLIKPNAEEAAEVIGRPVRGERDAVEAVTPFLEAGVELVALSLAEAGLVLAGHGKVVCASPPRVRVRNPVGAGDALLAGLAWALQQDLDLAEVARWGVATGTAAAMCDGVNFAALDDVCSVYAGVAVRRCQ